MPNRKVPLLEGNFYHVFSRGNRKEDIFFDGGDYKRFLDKTEEYRVRYSIAILAYSLLPNHFHFLLKQLSDVPISKFMAVLLNSYARYVSIKYELPTGHFFQGRFGVRLIDDAAGLLQNSRYIHLNIVKDQILKIDFTFQKDRNLRLYRGLIENARTYEWSSYGIYLGKNTSPVKVETDPILRLESGRRNYQKFVESKISDVDFRTLEVF